MIRARFIHGVMFAAVLSVLLVPSILSAQETKENPFEKEIQRFEQKDKKNPPEKGGIIFYGSSSIRFWNTDYDFPELHILNRGFGGSNAGDALLFADRVVIKHKPRLIVYYEGDNDLEEGQTPEAIFDKTKAFFEKVHEALPKTKIIYVSIKPSIERWKYIDQARATNKLVQDYIADKPYLHFMDVEPVMLGADGKPKPELFLKDNLHMNHDGYELWNAIIKPLLMEK